MRYHLAQVNIGRIVGPLDSEVLAGFVAQLDEINALAERSPGFVWRLKDATGVQAYEDPLILVNMSVWESVEALRQYVYKSGHASVLRDRAKWFEKPAQAYLAMWWIEAGHIPSVQEARERLEHRQKWGDSPIAFSFRKLFPEALEVSLTEPRPRGSVPKGFVEALPCGRGSVALREILILFRQPTPA